MKKIQLSQGKFAIVDDEDYERVMALGKWCWANGYAVKRVGRSSSIKMHRFIMNTPEGMETDHINRDKLDNRKENLRICRVCENQWNRSKTSINTTGFKGVYAVRSKYKAVITVNRKKIWLGLFASKIEAAKAYNKAAIKHHGKFANLNQISECI